MNDEQEPDMLSVYAHMPLHIHTQGMDGQSARVRTFQDEGSAGQSCTHESGTFEGQKETHVHGGSDERGK